MPDFSVGDTIVAVATPPGPGGLGVVRLSGPDAETIAGRLAPGCTLEPRRATFTRLVDPGGPARSTLDQVVIQSPPGNGILVPTGKLGVDAGASAALDIYSLLGEGVTIGNFPFAALSVNGRYRFYSINLTTGQALSLGRLGEPVIDIAIPLAQ